MLLQSACALAACSLVAADAAGSVGSIAGIALLCCTLCVTQGATHTSYPICCLANSFYAVARRPSCQVSVSNLN
jgi:hypothetical protein